MERLNTLVAERPELYVFEAWDLITHGTKLLEDSMILMHFIKCTIKTYTALAENFTTMAAPIMLMARGGNGRFSQSQNNEVLSFVENTKNIFNSFSAISLSISEAVGGACFINGVLAKRKKTESLFSLKSKSEEIFSTLLTYENKVADDEYSKIYQCMTSVRVQLAQNLAFGCQTELIAERILVAILRAQRNLEAAVLARP